MSSRGGGLGRAARARADTSLRTPLGPYAETHTDIACPETHLELKDNTFTAHTTYTYAQSECGLRIRIKVLRSDLYRSYFPDRPCIKGDEDRTFN